MYPTDRQYSKEHEWVLLETDGRAMVGVTQYAQEQLGDVVFVDLPEIGSIVSQFDKLGEVESVKAVSDVYSPIGGEVLEVNEAVIDHPELINVDPYDKGWLIRMGSVNPIELSELMSSAEYEKFLTQFE
ncbi:MAG: glycine cleavage system protein H [SAR202 cluster bacterium Io17-Chloro-G3]|nr:MAG: glycine cleavage system protein H [SAR202 cluster bacterium Io17-Chloro-G3]